MRGAIPVLLLLAVSWLAFPGCTRRERMVREPRDEVTCTSNLECELGAECIRPHGEIKGVCGRLVDPHANPTTSIRRTVTPCETDFDCPVKFRCERTTASVGVCVTGP